MAERTNASGVILTYHRLFDEGDTGVPADPSEAFYAFPVSTFEEHLCYLTERNFKFALLEDFDGQSVGLPANTVVLTFDDGRASDLGLALPILRKYGLRAVFFICVDLVGRPGHMSWTDIEKLAAAGMSIQCHGLVHRDYSLLSEEEARQELQAARLSIERNLGQPIHFLSIPGGFASASVYRAGFAAGFSAICNSEQRIATAGARKLNRFVLRRGITRGRFEQLVARRRKQMFIFSVTRASTSALKSVIGSQRYEVLKRRLWQQ